jgi:nucleotidyltransferase/DNA polymerase involved in DNA repair
MPSSMALARCPNLVIVRPRFDVYQAISAQIHNIFAHYTDIFEPVALDEAYLDVRKSIGAENSFARDLGNKATCILELEQIAETLQKRLEKFQTSGRMLTLKVKFSDYQQITGSRTFESSINSLDTMVTEAKALFESIELDNRNIRLLGISISNLDSVQISQVIQLPLFNL